MPPRGLVTATLAVPGTPFRVTERATLLLLGALLLLLAAGRPAVAQMPEAVSVEVVAFRPEGRALAPGSTAVSELVVRGGGSARTVWIGYSVQDPTGRWFDVPAHRVTLPPGRAAAPQRKAWTVPSGAVPGDYRVVMAVWSAPPGEPGTQRLASADRGVAFRVRVPARGPADGSTAWVAADHALGRGRLLPEQVFRMGRGFRLRLPAGRCDGAEVRTGHHLRHGEYSARMRTPVAPGSLSALFLYEDVPGGNDEIDLEIHNDGSRRALLTTWIAGKTVRQAAVTLPFDPAAAPHDYTIRWTAQEVVFLADGVPLGRWKSGYPRRPMRVVANVWWPTWLPCQPPPSPRDLEIEWLRLRPEEGTS